jgi:hypothetical protein
MPKLTQKEFLETYDKLVPKCSSYKEAYMKAEQEHLDMFGCEKYSSYETFRVIKHHANK